MSVASSFPMAAGVEHLGSSLVHEFCHRQIGEDGQSGAVKPPSLPRLSAPIVDLARLVQVPRSEFCAHGTGNHHCGRRQV